MRRRFLYFLLSLRSSLKLIPAFLVTGILVFAAMAAVVSGVAEDGSLVKIGVCGDVDSVYVSLAAGFLKESETAEIVVFDSEEEALEALRSREIQGFATVPEGFITNALRGKNIPLTYTVLKSPSSLSHALTQEVVELLSPVVYSSQNAVFGMRRYLLDIGEDGIASEETDKMAIEYVLALLDRDSLFDVTVTGVSDGVGLQDYYKAAAWVLFVLICGTVALPKKLRRNTSLSALLSFKGIGAVGQLLCEWAAFSVTVCIVSSVFGAALFGGIGYGVALIPALLPLTAMQLLIFEISSSAVSGTLLQFFTVAVTAYLSGLFYPSFFFPEGLQRLGGMLPTGQSFTYVKQAVSATLTWESALWVAVTSVILIALTVAVRRFRMRGEGI